jgi:hypothetical protein
MEQLYIQLAQTGAVGLLAAVLLWQVFFFGKKIFSVIENNTKALTELSTLIKSNYARNNHERNN